MLQPSAQGKRINRVACGSAHTLAWSTNKTVATSRLPSTVPMEYDLLKEMPTCTLRNRLVLLHHFSDLFCPCLAMFSLGLQGSGGEAAAAGGGDDRGGSGGGGRSPMDIDQLRSLLVSTAKESAFRKVSCTNAFLYLYLMLCNFFLLLSEYTVGNVLYE